MKLIYNGLWEIWVEAVKILTVPMYMPLPPRPAIALPTIMAFIVGAAPQTADPTSKTKIAVRNIGLLSNWP